MSVCVTTYGQKTTRTKLKLEQTSQCTADTVVANKGDIKFSGYDKTQSAPYESVFVTNNTEYDITAIIMTLVYYDKNGNRIHSRQWTARCLLAPGETRVIDIKSWDKQGAWYYKHTHSRKNKKGSQYDVKIKADYLVISH